MVFLYAEYLLIILIIPKSSCTHKHTYSYAHLHIYTHTHVHRRVCAHTVTHLWVINISLRLVLTWTESRLWILLLFADVFAYMNQP